MTLLDGETLWHLVWILPLLALIFYWGSRKRKFLLQKLLGNQAADPARVNSSPVLRFWRAVLFAGILILLLAAAARPSWGTRILPYTGQGRDLMVVFDVSKSMLSKDVQPSRLDHAKWLVRQLCTRNPGDRFGLIAFAGNAFLECPLTIDQTSFLQSVDELSVDTIPVGGTNIQQALTEAIRGFRAAETPHRAVILITDGDELTGKSTDALERIIQLKIPLFILGIGDPSQPAIVQMRDEKGNVQTLKDSQGNVVSVPLNEKMLAELASKTGGIYVRSTTTHPGLEQIEARIKKLEKHDIDSGKQTRPIERPLYPLLGAFILFCLWLLLGERKNFAVRNTAKLLLICGLAGFACSMQAQTAQDTSEKPAAETAENKAENKPAEQTANLSPEELYNRGLKAQTQEKDLKKAVELYEQVIAAGNASPEIRSKAAQNLGVISHQQARALLQQTGQTLQAQQLDPALQQTDQALKQMAVTEEIYKNSLRDSSDVAPVSRNQYQLLQDRKYAEELKKKIEELKKKQQEARKNTQQAMNQQKQQQQKQDQQKNQQKQDQQQQQKQDQQKDQKQNQQQKQKQQQQQKQDQQKDHKQDQQKNQQKENQQQSQPQNQQQTDKARESVRQLEQQARDLNQKKMEDQAKKAGEELDKARQAQKQEKDKEAEKHLQKALEHLGKDQPDQKQNKPDQKQGQDQKQDQKQNKPDQKNQPKPDKQLPKPAQGQQQKGKPEPEKEINKDQAEALLDLMAGDEKKLKDELKARMKQNYGTRPVDKDW